MAGASVLPTTAATAGPFQANPSLSKYHEIVAFYGSTSTSTRAFVIPTNARWHMRWRFECDGVANPAFVATGFERSKRERAISVFRSRRLQASGLVKSTQIGTFHYRVSSDCPWHLTVYREVIPSSANPFAVSAMRSYLESRAGTVTAAVYDVQNGQTDLYRPGVAEQTASIIKVDILATLLWEQQGVDHSLDPDDVGLATGMIEYSDNDDATDLWDEVGGSQALARFDALCGLTDTSPNAEGYWGESTTTALDQVDLLKHVTLEDGPLDSASREFELGLMEHVASYEHWGISSGPTSPATVALKNGWLPLTANDWQINSIGYVDGDGRQYLIAVLTTGDPTESYGIETVETISDVVWSVLARAGGS